MDAGELSSHLDPAVARMLIIGALNWAVEWWPPDRPVDELVETSRTWMTAALAGS